MDIGVSLVVGDSSISAIMGGGDVVPMPGNVGGAADTGMHEHIPSDNGNYSRSPVENCV